MTTLARRIFAIITPLRGAIFVSALLSMAFLVPAQTGEIVALYFEAMAQAGGIPANYVIVYLLVVAYLLAFGATTRLVWNMSHSAGSLAGLRGVLWRGLIALLAVAPLASLAYAMWPSSISLPEGSEGMPITFFLPSILLLATALFVLIRALTLGSFMGRAAKFAGKLDKLCGHAVQRFRTSIRMASGAANQRDKIYVRIVRRLRPSILFIAGLIPFVMLTLVFIWSPFWVPGLLNPIGILFAFGIAAIIFLNACVILHGRTGIPVIWLLVILAGTYSALNINDNHQIRTFSAASSGEIKAPQDSARPTTRDFEAWLQSRPDAKAFASGKYPVYIVATAGGGAYAGYYSAMYLARIQDQCPNFANHVFAISGVSGGSVGASVFASLVGERSEQPEQAGCRADGTYPHFFADNTRLFFASDFLSPLLAATLFPDFAQRLLPVSIGALDRARALEYSFERGWGNMFPATPNPFAASFEAWNPGASKPALFLNATDVGSGGRIIVSPMAISRFKWRDPDRDPDLALYFATNDEYEAVRELQQSFTIDFFDDLKTSRMIPLSTAVGLSARFPFVTPAATIPVSLPGKTSDDGKAIYEERHIRVVDGGYNDNSGVGTALEIIRSIERGVPPEIQAKAQINLIILDMRRASRSGLKLDALSRGPLPGFGELLSPLSTLAGIRNARLIDTVKAASAQLDGNYGERKGFAFKRTRGAYIFDTRRDDQRFLYDDFGSPDEGLPLGWALSDHTKTRIEDAASRSCQPSENMVSTVSNVELSYRTSMSDPYADAGCVAWMIKKELANDLAGAEEAISFSHKIEEFPGMGVCKDHAEEYPEFC